MSNFEFISSLVASLAWPMTLIFIVCLFLSELKDLLARMEFFKGPGVEFGLRKSLERGRESSEKVAIERSDLKQLEAPAVLSKEELEFAENFPGGAIDMFYKRAAARLLGLRAELPDQKPHRNLDEVMKRLKDSGQVTQNTVDLWRAIRDSHRIVYGLNPRRIFPAEAVAYGTQVKQLLEALSTVRFAK